ncbi:uncharacterized protein LOC108732490 [Agrilus planipennis]|uniref:Uncharacterized protein LOC108732490 n=1 Tax=Agrilus planipennis TaxID=224129 RepID=A0A1W4W405_AGRPL|nr:uncharacterized protein LOC108732490 [Agrilus planipennis]
MKGNMFFYFLAISLVISAIMTPEAEARRKILKGRRTVTRTYFRNLLIPAWAVILLVGIGQVIIGAIFFLILKKIILDPPLTGLYAPPPNIEA